MTFECHLKETLINDIKQNLKKEVSFERTLVTNTSSTGSAFVTEISKLKMSDSETKKHRQMDMGSKLLTHGVKWMDIVCKGRNDVNVNEKVKSKYVCKGIGQLDNNKEDCGDSLPQKAEAFYKKESSTSLIYCQTDELNEYQSTDL